MVFQSPSFKCLMRWWRWRRYFFLPPFFIVSLLVADPLNCYDYCNMNTNTQMQRENRVRNVIVYIDSILSLHCNSHLFARTHRPKDTHTHTRCNDNSGLWFLDETFSLSATVHFHCFVIVIVAFGFTVVEHLLSCYSIRYLI